MDLCRVSTQYSGTTNNWTPVNGQLGHANFGYTKMESTVLLLKNRAQVLIPTCTRCIKTFV